ncbi:glutathione S-transferase family protein [Solimonas terrae]|uniref:Glutathione S-transferase family protein n=1 Tax=Solimonas terrae TaxID=1396819 RepID=A0A6M2BUU6_9GAMM|nr:glutathione S-transferase family protein [Solimonas terrae]NGY05769.1 glutathione S-transferase family protein [Solimonas terrae]
MSLKLHVFPPSPRAFKVLFAAHQLDVDYELVPVNFANGGTKTPGFTALNPNQRMPVLEHDDFSLWESNAIVQYLASLKPESGYLPADLNGRMQAIKWQFWESSHWDPACAIYMFENVVKKLFSLGEPNPAELERGRQLFARLGPVLDGQLGRTACLAGPRMTVADLSVAPSLSSAELAQMPIADYPNLQRWLAEMQALPAWGQARALQRPAA